MVVPVSMYLSICVQSLSWGESTANPSGHLLRWWSGGDQPLMTVLRLLSGSAGALASYSVISPVWDMEWSHFHTGRTGRTAAGICGSDLQVGDAEIPEE